MSQEIPFNQLRICPESLRIAVDEAIARVVSSHWFILGAEVESFEREFAEAMDVDHAVGVASGTDAITLSLMALGVGGGDEVITTSLTAAFSALAISRTGAQPVFADIDPETLNLSPEEAEKCVGPRTKAILPVHLYGNPCDLDALKRVAERHQLALVEDACQAHGARFQGRAVGGIGHAGAFSFYPTKNLGALGDGGMVVTNDAELAERVKRLRNGGQSSRYRHQEIGLNSRLDELQAAVLRAKLPYLPEDNRKRAELVARYRKGLDAVAGDELSMPSVATGSESAHHLLVVRLAERDALMAHLAERKIQTLIHYPIPTHLQPAYRDLGLGPGSLPEAERAASDILSLPLYPTLAPDEVDRVVDAIAAFYDG